MYSLDDLFENRIVVGVKIEQILSEQNSNKVKLSKETGISRPTIDKVLAGNINSKNNYNKHISKVLKAVDATPDLILGGVSATSRTMRIIREIEGVSLEDISKKTRIPVLKLEEIEAGGAAMVSTMREIAGELAVGVKDINGESYFGVQIGLPEKNINSKGMEFFSGFWGYAGILANNTDEYQWFPITSTTKDLIYEMSSSSRIVIPAMNNKIVLLNTPNIKDIMLVDSIMELPESLCKNLNVNGDEIPYAIFEALDDYIMLQGNHENLSVRLREKLEKAIRYNRWSESEIFDILNCAIIHHNDGSKRNIYVDFDKKERFTTEITNVYELDDSEFYSDNMFYTDLEGGRHIVNASNIAFVELPLLKVEKKIYEEQKRFKEELKGF